MVNTQFNHLKKTYDEISRAEAVIHWTIFFITELRSIYILRKKQTNIVYWLVCWTLGGTPDYRKKR